MHVFWTHIILNIQNAPRDGMLFHFCDCVTMSVIIYQIESVKQDECIAHVSLGFSMMRDTQQALQTQCSRHDSGAIREYTTI